MGDLGLGFRILRDFGSSAFRDLGSDSAFEICALCLPLVASAEDFVQR